MKYNLDTQICVFLVSNIAPTTDTEWYNIDNKMEKNRIEKNNLVSFQLVCFLIENNSEVSEVIIINFLASGCFMFVFYFFFFSFASLAFFK